MFHPTINRMLNLIVLFALLTSTLAVTPATASKVIELEQPLESSLASELPNGITTRVSIGFDGTQANGRSDFPSISANGRFVVFQSAASNLVPGDTNGVADVFVYDRLTGQTTCVSISSDGSQSNGGGIWSSISADGRYVAFASGSTNLVPGDTNSEVDIFVHDRQIGRTTRVSVASNGSQADKESSWPSISADGRYVAFRSRAENLVINDTNDRADIFVHDQKTGETTRVSVSSSGIQADLESSSWPKISADGRYVVFTSRASNLVLNDNDGGMDVFIHDLQTRQTTTPPFVYSGNVESQVSISADGRFVTFVISYVISNFWFYEMLVYDQITSEITSSSIPVDDIFANGRLGAPSISADGRIVAFQSWANNIIPPHFGTPNDILAYDRDLGLTTPVAVATDGTRANNATDYPSISADGRFVAFYSWADNLVPGDTNGVPDIFVHDRLVSSNVSLGPKKEPVILVHGWQGLNNENGGYECGYGIQRYNGINSTLTPDKKLDNYSHIAEWLDQDGYEVWIAHLESNISSTITLEENMFCLKNQIQKVWAENPQPISLISHSMGGLVSRGAIFMLPERVEVKSLYTLGTPHAGVPTDLLIRFQQEISLFKKTLNCDDQVAACQMATQNINVFNSKVPSRAGVQYHFYGGDGAQFPINEIIKNVFKQGPNDGLVGQYSAVGWMYPNQEFFNNWHLNSPPEQYFTNETHPGNSDPEKALYVAPMGEYSQSYACIRDLMKGLSGTSSCDVLNQSSLDIQALSTAPQATSFEAVAFTESQIGTLEAGQSTTFPLELDASGETIFYLNWGAGAAPDFTLTRPDLVEINPQYAADNPTVVTYENGDGTAQSAPYQTYHFPAGLAGTWQVSLTATSDPIDYQVFAMLDSSRTFTAELDQDTYQIGETATLSTSLTSEGAGLDGATVTATFTSPDGTQTDLTLTDHLDGSYSVTYPIPFAPGYLTVSLTASGEDNGTAYTRSTNLLAAIAPDGLTLTDIYNEEALDEDGNSLYESLAFDIGLDLDEASAYAISAELYAGDQLVTQAGDFFDLEAGSQTVRLLFDGQSIRDSGLDGPYTVTNLYLTPLDVGILASSAVDVLQTGPYQHNQFGSTPPAAFGKLLAEDGVTLDFLSTLLMWGGSDRAVTYEYCLDTTDNDTCDTAWQSVVDSIFVTLADLNPGTTYHWQVRAINRGGSTEADGAAWWSFITPAVVSEPAAFGKISPLDAATNIPQAPTLTWASSMGADDYEYCIDTSDNDTCDATWVFVDGETTAALDNLVFDTTYYWHVRANNSGGTTYADDNGWWVFSTEAPANPIPTITSISPNNATSGGSAFTLTVNGTNFVNSSKVRWNGSDRTTTYVNSTQLTASITAADIASVGTATVTVFTPTPGGGTSGGVTFTINSTNPVPTVSSISPTSATAGGSAFTLTVNGTNFVSGSKVRWNNVDRVTTYISSTQLTASITAADIASVGTATVTVFTPAPGGGTSGSVTFTINSTNPVPTVSSISPTSATAGGSAFTLTVNGTNFVNSSKVRWNGSDRTTTYVNSTQLTASITAADIASVGTATVTVFTPTPGGGTSGGVTFTINSTSPAPTVSSISPTSATAGGSAFTLTVNGTNFVSGSKVRWNGSDRTTTYANSTQLTASITAADIASVGATTVTVFTPAPGGGTSGGVTFTIKQPSATFADVPVTYWAWSFIERLYNAGITGGCATTPILLYCPDNTVTRAQMAVFLLKSMHGAGFNPPQVGDSTGFGDVATNHWAAPWIKQLALEGITGGCGNGNYCPEAPVTRAQMAVFLLKAKNGSGYAPPLIGDGSGFTDVPANYWAAVWIKQLAADGITGGCGAGIYCPENPVTRAQMAVFIVKTFGLP